MLEAKAEWKREMAAFEEQQNQMPAVQYLEPRDYLGMFEYRIEDEPTLVQHLIIGMISLRLALLSEALVFFGEMAFRVIYFAVIRFVINWIH